MYSSAAQLYLLVVGSGSIENDYTLKTKNIPAGSHLHLLSIIDNIGGYDLNKITFDFKNVKKNLEESGFDCTSEVIKVTKGEDSKEQIIAEYANKMKAILLT